MMNPLVPFQMGVSDGMAPPQFVPSFRRRKHGRMATVGTTFSTTTSSSSTSTTAGGGEGGSAAAAAAAAAATMTGLVRGPLQQPVELIAALAIGGEGEKGTDLQRASLFEERAELEAQERRNPVDALLLVEMEERGIMGQLEQTRELKSVQEIAAGTSYREPLESSWRPPAFVEALGEPFHARVREMVGIDVEGSRIPPPLLRFRDMRLPRPLLAGLESKGIREPSAIQVQAIPCGLARRDLIGISFTGSGKTLAFLLPALTVCAEYEARLPLGGGEGPVAIVLTPSRELARQIHGLAEEYLAEFRACQMARMSAAICIGGVDMREVVDDARRRGVHLVVATPGRLLGLLKQGVLNLAACQMLVLDEADRLLSEGFEEDVRTLLSYFRGQRQTLLFSATMPQKIQLFAKSALVEPVVVNVGRAGAASLSIRQDVELVPKEERFVRLLHSLQKTPPPVLVFAENKSDADMVHEYLLIKGVEAVAIHGGLFQDERDEAIVKFRKGEADVLVATDVVSKGLDFQGIEHVVNFDMPDTIENYVHRIGRTGRFGFHGVATTYINSSQSETILLDLKHLLTEASQRIPQFLLDLQGSEYAKMSIGGIVGCAFCGGSGHRVSRCDRLEKHQRQLMGQISRASDSNM